MSNNSVLESLKNFSNIRLTQLEDARYFFERALYDEPDSSDACAGLGQVFYLSGLKPEAKIMFEWALWFDPGNSMAGSGLFKINCELGLNHIRKVV